MSPVSADEIDLGSRSRVSFAGDPVAVEVQPGGVAGVTGQRRCVASSPDDGIAPRAAPAAAVECRRPTVWFLRKRLQWPAGSSERRTRATDTSSGATLIRHLG